jgi:hypothetical protein
MKSIIRVYFITLMILASNAYAQENRGSIMISGDGSYFQRNSDHSTKVNNPSNSSYDVSGGNIHLNVGYFVSNRLALGLTGQIGAVKSTKISDEDPVNIYTEKNLNTLYSGGIFGRYNQPFGKSKLGVFLNWSHAYQRFLLNTHSERSSPNLPDVIYDNRIEEQGYISSFTPGLFYFISNCVSMELHLGDVTFEAYKTKEPTKTVEKKYRRLYSNFSITSISLGVTFYFGKGKSKTFETQVESSN